MNLHEIKATLEGLNPETRILYLSFVADLCDPNGECDELTEGLQAIAVQYAMTRTKDEFAVGDIADGIIPQAGSTRQDWEAHRAMRDATLAHALAWNVRRAAA
jgi:predicted HAD superfamily hydrolase